jgi:hypothetical protein
VFLTSGTVFIYNKWLLEDLKKAARVIVDFEIAAKIAFESVFEVKVIGCLFHFGQSLFFKTVQSSFETTIHR